LRAGAGDAAQSTSFQSFGQYSEFLRSAVADEESLQMGDALQALAAQVEALMGLLQPKRSDEQKAAQALVQLVDDLREHRAMLLGLSADWHHFFEFDAHFVALNQFRTRVTRWAVDAAPPGCRLPSPADFDVAAWRLLGAGAMLLDVYEQSRVTAPAQRQELTSTSVSASASASAPVSLLGRVSGWWRRHLSPTQEQRKPGRRGRRQSDK